MPTINSPGPIDSTSATDFREAVCVHTGKIFDSCRDKDCLEDLRLFPTVNSIPIINSAVAIRPRSGELLFASVDVEEVSFNRGYFSVDIRFFYRIRGDAYSLINRSSEFQGLCVSDKRVILFGSEGNAKIFSSDTVLGGIDTPVLAKSKLPKAYIEAVDPVVLSMRLTEPDISGTPANMSDVPEFISENFDSDISLDFGNKMCLVTLGQFSLVRLERDSQLLIPSYDYFIPEKECGGGDSSDPCTLFSGISFPVDEFFPPDSLTVSENYREAITDFSR